MTQDNPVPQGKMPDSSSFSVATPQSDDHAARGEPPPAAPDKATIQNGRPVLASMPPYVTPKQVELLTAIRVKTLETMRSQLRGPPWIKIGRMVRYRLADVISWVEAGAAPAPQPARPPRNRKPR